MWHQIRNKGKLVWCLFCHSLETLETYHSSTLDHLPKFQGKKASQKSLKPPNRILRTTTIPPPPPLLFCCNLTLNKKVTNTTFSWGNEKRLPSGKLTEAHENPPFPIGNTGIHLQMVEFPASYVRLPECKSGWWFQPTHLKMDGWKPTFLLGR